MKGEIELEMVPQGTLAERIRAGGAGIAGFYVPAGEGTIIAEGKELRSFDGREYLLELGLKADFALIKAYRADSIGNLTYHMTARNFNPVLAMAVFTNLFNCLVLHQNEWHQSRVMTRMAKDPSMTTTHGHLTSANATNNPLCFVAENFSVRDNLLFSKGLLADHHPAAPGAPSSS